LKLSAPGTTPPSRIARSAVAWCRGVSGRSRSKAAPSPSAMRNVRGCTDRIGYRSMERLSPPALTPNPPPFPARRSRERGLEPRFAAYPGWIRRTQFESSFLRKA
jgi:hypothetical protein